MGIQPVVSHNKNVALGNGNRPLKLHGIRSLEIVKIRFIQHLAVEKDLPGLGIDVQGVVSFGDDPV